MVRGRGMRRGKIGRRTAEPMGAVGLAGDPEAVVADRADVVLRRHRRRRRGAHPLPLSSLERTRCPRFFSESSSAREEKFGRAAG